MNGAPAADAWRSHRPLLLPALALWGWQCGFLWPALAMGLVLEAPRLLRPRLDIGQRDWDRLWSFTAVLFLAVVFYLLLARQGLDGANALFGDADAAPAEGEERLRRVSGTALTVLRWLPFILLPFTAAVAWSRTIVLPWSTFSLYEQARQRRHPGAPVPEWATRPVHPGYLYLVATAFAAITTAEHPDSVLPGLLAVLCLALWPWRNRRFGLVAWAAVLLWLGGVALVARHAHQGTRALWLALEEGFQGGGMGGIGGGPDQQRRITAIGAVGRLHGSGAVVLRLRGDALPDRLQEAAFDRFRGRAWEVSPQAPAAPALAAHPAAPAALGVDRYALPGATPLALPVDVVAVQTPAGSAPEAAGLAGLRLRDAPPLLRYRAWRGAGGGIDPPPGAADLALDGLEAGDRELLLRLADSIPLAGTPAQRAEALQRWFAAGFTYRLWQGPADPAEGSPLRRFLTATRSGHCEYFATACVLLLRAAGVPARYAVGWSLEGDGEGRALARGRDAHAWCQAWIDGAWRVVDATPGSWRAAEEARAPWYEAASDAWDRLWYEVAVARQYGGAWRTAALVAGLLVLAWIGWRQVRGSRWRRAGSAAAAPPPRHGLDSELLPLIARLEARGGPRPPGRTLAAWLAAAPPPGDPDAWRAAVALHQRLRFDPAGLGADERARLADLVRRLAAALAAAQR